MFDHVVIGVSDYETSRTFFLKELEPLGVAIVQEGPLGTRLSTDGRSTLCLFPTEEKPAYLHLAFHRMALAAGGRDNGRPGLRPQYHAAYCAAFVIGPDGHNIEAICHKREG